MHEARVKVEAVQNSFERLTVNFLSEFDVILGADICFWDEMSQTLFNLAKRARKANVAKIIIADPCRSPFTMLTERCTEKLDNVSIIKRRISRPVKASGEILIIENK